MVKFELSIKVQQFGQCIYKKIHNFDLNKVIQNVSQYAQHHVTYAPAKFKVAASNGLEEGALTRKYKVTCNVAQYPLYHVTYSLAKFEVAMPKHLGGNPFTRNVTGGCTDRQTD